MTSPHVFSIDAENITVIYPGGIVANRKAYLRVKRGEILALLGENGAGKTTLVKVLAGMVKPITGSVRIGERYLKLGDPRDSLRAGFFLVTQHPLVFDDLTVAEDVGLAVREAGLDVSLSWVKRRIDEISRQYGLGLDPERYVWSLSIGEKHKVELVKALIVGSKAIAFDETTAHLTPIESTSFLQMLRKLAGEGRSIVFITHKIKEALEVADRIQVMRKGEVVGVLDRRTATLESLVKLMFGERVQETITSYRGNSSVSDEDLLIIRNLWVRDDRGHYSVKDFSLNVRKGEIVGIAGVAGNGQRELFESIAGLRRPDKGKIIIMGEDVTHKPPSERLKLGLSVIPEERLGWALARGLPVYVNVALPLLGSQRLGLWIDWSSIKRMTSEIIEALHIETKGVDSPVDSLSGGNMQRLIVGRELITNPKLIVAMNPTAGLDYNSTLGVRKILAEIASRGTGLLLISEDLDELLEVSDRIAVVSRGRLTGLFSRPFDYVSIAKAMVA